MHTSCCRMSPQYRMAKKENSVTNDMYITFIKCKVYNIYTAIWTCNKETITNDELNH